MWLVVKISICLHHEIRQGGKEVLSRRLASGIVCTADLLRKRAIPGQLG